MHKLSLKIKYEHGIWGSNTTVFMDDLIKGLQERSLVRLYTKFNVFVSQNPKPNKNNFRKYLELLLQNLIATSSSNSTSSVHNTNKTAKTWTCEINKKLTFK
jgi:hypothetical protein